MTGIFKAYDVRGVYPGELDETTAEKIGVAFANLMNSGSIAVGRDCRPSSPAIASAFIRGYIRGGGRVTDFGLASSPLLYYAIISGNFDGGAMVTASHLPPEINGIKLCREQAIPLSGDKGLPALEHLVATDPGKGQTPDRPAPGLYTRGDMTGSYIDMVAGFIHARRPLTLAIDAGDGMAGPEIQRLFAKIPTLTTVAVNLEPDGRFPHHGANPFLLSATNELQELVRESGADFGAAFDGDADRCIFIDEKGARVPADLVTALIAQHYLLQEPGATVLYDLRSSRVVAETVSHAGGRGLRCRVGHAFIKEQMRQENALFAGELSGHYYFRDTGFCDNGIIAMVQMINLLSEKDLPLSQLVAPLKKYSSTGEINIQVNRLDLIMGALRSAFPDAQTNTLDGLTMEYPAWWFNIRSSHTEPLIRLNLEADTKACMNKYTSEVLQVIRDADPSIQIEKE
ncbi:MAG: phosphomannomutase/phosphoglucomutase [Methanoregula sp.]|uniref:phosphomannomutase/phosphoglucomutase n=2 Tax=Methanoregula sp. TaxID=2052170 RepID=UPI003C43C714